MPGKAGLLSTKAWLQNQLENRGSFVRYSLSTMADSNSCALVIRLRKEKRVVALPRVKFVDKNLSCQEVLGKGCQACCLRTENSNSIRRKEEEETLSATSC